MFENRVAGVGFNGFLRLARVSMASEIPGRASPAAWLARRQARAVFWWSDGYETANYNDRLWRLRERIEREERKICMMERGKPCGLMAQKKLSNAQFIIRDFSFLFFFK